ncbi:hypothetical protein [Larkinella terrae]|uniref:Restriction endonuclease n=1 Tax=Larkinella terrae TaxID=2025311 RepID=A0A7K0EI70_9BACT|nr:hypothetical protein [Larkinella terrae]MRS61291.1 hypothetical protein [Larkinella terrae]
MKKTIQFTLNKFPTIPDKLRKDPTINFACNEFDVDLCRLYHHYYTDSYNISPPDPDHTNFEYLRFMASCMDFRFFGEGPAANTAKKRALSNELGQAFCRYFLYEFCGITYFAHMDKVLNKEAHPAFNGLKIKRIVNGDVPDYLCAKSVDKPFIGEAKGRFNSINFNSNEFDKWREQFKRISVNDRFDRPNKVKGYIIGTRFCTENNRVNTKSKIFAEDPETDGKRGLLEDEIGLGRGCIAVHYSRLVYKLGLNLIANALDLGFTIPQDLRFNLPVWRCNFGPIAGERFIGGYFGEVEPHMVKTDSNRIHFQPNILKLGVPSHTFFGLKIEVFRSLRKACLGDWSQLVDLPQLPDTYARPSNLAWLRDGSISGGLEFFEFEGFQQI